MISLFDTRRTLESRLPVFRAVPAVQENERDLEVRAAVWRSMCLDIFNQDYNIPDECWVSAGKSATNSTIVPHFRQWQISLS